MTIILLSLNDLLKSLRMVELKRTQQHIILEYGEHEQSFLRKVANFPVNAMPKKQLMNQQVNIE